MDPKGNKNNLKKGWITQNQCFHIRLFIIVLKFPNLVINFSFKITFRFLTIFKLLIYTLFFLSQLISILPIEKASWKSNVYENWFTMVAMLLKFNIIIFPFVNFPSGACILVNVIIDIEFVEVTPMNSPSKRTSLNGGVHHKLSISRNFNKIHENFIKQCVHAKFVGFKMQKWHEKIFF